MASAAEQLAANFRFDAFTKEGTLRDRLLFTFGCLLIYRFGTYVPTPGIDPVTLAAVMNQQAGGLLGQLNLLAGGAVSRMSIFTLSIIPYISASIVMQLMSAVSKKLEALKKEGPSGQRKINQYTRYLTVLLCVGQSFGIAVGLESTQGLVQDPGLFFRIQTVIAMTGGTVFLMWLGEQITARGLGQGISLLIFTGIIAEMPRNLVNLLQTAQLEGVAWQSFVIPVVIAVLLVLVVFIERSYRRLVVQYPKRVVGNRQTEGQTQYMPLKLNLAGVIPVIFASSLLILPQTIVEFGVGTDNAWSIWLVQQLTQGQPGYVIFYGLLIVFFTFFYASIVFNPEETAENLKKGGGYIPGVRPGKNTAVYIDYVMSRITVFGAFYLTFVALLPQVWADGSGAGLIFGGTSILIVVSVTIDTISRVQSHMLAQQYETLLEKQRIRTERDEAPKKPRRRTRR